MSHPIQQNSDALGEFFSTNSNGDVMPTDLPFLTEYGIQHAQLNSGITPRVTSARLPQLGRNQASNNHNNNTIENEDNNNNATNDDIAPDRPHLMQSPIIPTVQMLEEKSQEYLTTRATQQTTVLLEDELISYFFNRIKDAFQFSYPKFEQDFGLECITLLKSIFFFTWEGRDVQTYVAELQNVNLGQKKNSTIFSRLGITTILLPLFEIIGQVVRFFTSRILYLTKIIGNNNQNVLEHLKQSSFWSSLQQSTLFQSLPFTNAITSYINSMNTSTQRVMPPWVYQAAKRDPILPTEGPFMIPTTTSNSATTPQHPYFYSHQLQTNVFTNTRRFPYHQQQSTNDTRPIMPVKPQNDYNIQTSHNTLPQYTRGLSFTTRLLLYCASIIIPFAYNYFLRFVDHFKPPINLENAQQQQQTQQNANNTTTSTNDTTQSTTTNNTQIPPTEISQYLLTPRQYIDGKLHEICTKLYKTDDYQEYLSAHLRKFKLAVRILTFINTILWLYNGEYLTLTDRLMNIVYIIQDPTLPPSSILFDSLHRSILFCYFTDALTFVARGLLSLSNTTSSLYRYYPVLLPLGFATRKVVNWFTTLEKNARDAPQQLEDERRREYYATVNARNRTNDPINAGNDTENQPKQTDINDTQGDASLLSSTMSYVKNIFASGTNDQNNDSSSHQQQDLSPGARHPITNKMIPFDPCPSCLVQPPTHPARAAPCNHIYCYYCIDILYQQRHVCQKCHEPIIGYHSYTPQEPLFERPEDILRRKMQQDEKGNSLPPEDCTPQYNTLLQQNYEAMKKKRFTGEL